MTTPSGPVPKSVRSDEAAIRKIAMAYPEVREDHPWGHSAFKVKGKAFVFMSASSEGLSLSTKLPDSRYLALELPFAEPTGYGLGKSGWVSASFAPGQAVPLPLLASWIDESYRAIAPKKLAAALGSARATSEGKKPVAKKKAAKKTPSKTTAPKSAKPKKVAKKTASKAR